MPASCYVLQKTESGEHLWDLGYNVMVFHKDVGQGRDSCTTLGLKVDARD